MAINRDRSKKAMENAEREFRNAVECMEYAVKGILIAYGIDFPRIHAVGRFLYEIEEKYPKWFSEQIQSIGEVADGLARAKPRFRYPYEYPPEEYGTDAREILPKVEKALGSCRRLIKDLFG